MMRLLLRTDILFGITALLVLLTGLTCFRSTFELAIHSTYFIIPQVHITSGIAAVLLFIAGIYFMFIKLDRPLKKRLGQWHYFISTAGLLAIVFPPASLFPAARYQPGSNAFEPGFDINALLALLLMLVLFAQLLFLINIVLTVFGKNLRGKNTDS